ncbi:ankyrin repeat domain-containing protein [Flavobacterium sp.]|uniref:ankyrin repeat domain-containing protein n=1 Tax=Flavobacterium sp. TaxID=239 RepID=UPI0028BEFB93|nr:ankyrin repeat domain-containing protein [Flavobacterium sp.]
MRKIIFIALLFFWVDSIVAQQDIFEIARSGTVEELQKVVDKEPNSIHSVNKDGYSLLTLATYRGNNKIAVFLIEKGADINGKSNYGTPLMAAVVKGNKEIAEALVKHNADISLTDASGNSALIYAVLFKQYDLIPLLLKAKADVHAKDIRGNSAFDYAKISGDEKLVELLNH